MKVFFSTSIIISILILSLSSCSQKKADNNTPKKKSSTKQTNSVKASQEFTEADKLKQKEIAKKNCLTDPNTEAIANSTQKSPSELCNCIITAIDSKYIDELALITEPKDDVEKEKMMQNVLDAFSGCGVNIENIPD